MAEKEEEAPAKKGGWWKGIFGAVGGMLSGVVVMYLTPWVDKVVKPPAPVANFSVQYDGATAQFQNQSQPRGEGWWDFGDGSPLVPVSTDTEFLKHTYPRPGDYTVKLAIHNVLGEVNDRSVPIHIDSPTAPDKPQVASLEAVPVHQGVTAGAVYAPATFCFMGTVEHAGLYVWDFGDERPFEVTTDAAKGHCRHVTFKKPGRYVVKLLAVNGTQHDERSATVTVAEAPANSVSLVVSVTDDAAEIETTDRQVNLGVTYQADFMGDTFPFQQRFMASTGYTIGDVLIPPPVPGAPQMQMGKQTVVTLDCPALGICSARNLKFQMSEDRGQLTVTGELVRQAKLPALSMPLVLRQQRRVPVHQANPVSATLTLPGAGVTTSALLKLPPIPSDWLDCQRKMQLEVRAGEQSLWQDSQLPRGAIVAVGGRRYLLTTTVVNNQMRVDLVDATAGLPPTAN